MKEVRKIAVSVDGDGSSRSTQFTLDPAGVMGPSIDWTPQRKAGVAVDWYQDQLQFLVFDNEMGDPTVSVRMNDNGTVAEVAIDSAKKAAIKVLDDRMKSNWRQNPPPPTPNQPEKQEQPKVERTRKILRNFGKTFHVFTEITVGRENWSTGENQVALGVKLTGMTPGAMKKWTQMLAELQPQQVLMKPKDLHYVHQTFDTAALIRF